MSKAGYMRYVRFAMVLAVALCTSCTSADKAASPVAHPVEIVRDGGGFKLLRDDKPYVVHGAGIEFGSIESFAKHGGTAFRTWRTENGSVTGQQVLDEAHKHGLTVAMGIEIGRERHGFDYDDEEAVALQLEYARGEVLKYKDHPALLTWIIGNEANLHFENPKVFDAIDGISRMIHDVDGKHPTTTALAGFDAHLAQLIEERSPDLDFVSVQLYHEIMKLPARLEKMQFDRPYFVTEWGATGHWEVESTRWGAPIEPNSSDKAGHYLASYKNAIETDPDRILGSFAFLWGQKQERTPTWYGMFLEDGTETESVDVMHFIWTGSWPDNRSPRIESMLLDGKAADENVTLNADERYPAVVMATDPDGDTLEYRWVVMRESEATQTGGDEEEVPETIAGAVEAAASHEAELIAPVVQGAYRLFVYVYDDQNHAGHANVPFYVTAKDN